MADIKLDKTFQELKNSSQNIILFLESFNLFNNFDEKINQYCNEINYQKVISENLIIKNDEYYNLFSSKLNNLTNLSLEYYKNVNFTYNRMKNSIIEHIYEIGKLLNICANITYEIIPIKYMEIKNNVSSINESRYKEQNSIIIEDYTKISDETKHIIKTTIEKDIVENNFTLDIVVEEEEIKRTKVIEKVINKNKILDFDINIYSPTSQFCGKLGRIINPQFNDVVLSTIIIYDSGLNEAFINTTLFYDEYNIHTKFYQDIEISQTTIRNGMVFNLPTSCNRIYFNMPENEKELEIIETVTKNINKTISY